MEQDTKNPRRRCGGNGKRNERVAYKGNDVKCGHAQSNCFTSNNFVIVDEEGVYF